MLYFPTLPGLLSYVIFILYSFKPGKKFPATIHVYFFSLPWVSRFQYYLIPLLWNGISMRPHAQKITSQTLNFYTLQPKTLNPHFSDVSLNMLIALKSINKRWPCFRTISQSCSEIHINFALTHFQGWIHTFFLNLGQGNKRW